MSIHHAAADALAVATEAADANADAAEALDASVDAEAADVTATVGTENSNDKRYPSTSYNEER